MATVAIIHAAEDALPARALAEKLRQAKVTVLLEKQPGEELRAAVKDAKVTVALWSPRSVTQPALVDDANFAKGKSKLIHARMQNASAPEAFRSDRNMVNLTGWHGEDEFAPWRELAKLVTEGAGVAPLPPPAARPPSGFFQPGLVREMQPAAAGAPARSAPRPSAQPPRPQPAAPRPSAAPRTPAAPPSHMAEPAEPRSGGGRMVLIAIVTFLVIVLAGGGGYFFWTQSQAADTHETVWETVDRNDAGALRAFIDGDPGEYRNEAQQALADLEERSFEAASDADTIEALEAFLNDFPDSGHALRVRGRIAELRSLQPAPAPAPDAALPDAPASGETPDPDLVPPAVTAPQAPAPSAGGPAAITPPAEPEPDPVPAGDEPIN